MSVMKLRIKRSASLCMSLGENQCVNYGISIIITQCKLLQYVHPVEISLEKRGAKSIAMSE